MDPERKVTAEGRAAAERIRAARAARNAEKSGSTTPAAPTAPVVDKADPLISALTDRLERQGRGISSSSSSNIQNTINESIAGLEQAGESTFNRLQSERGREMGFAQDRAGASFSSALEGRSGFATQTIAFRELTETTEKSLRDLDARFQESIMANDATTATGIAALRLEKLKFQQQEEQSYYSNLISLAGLEEQRAGRMQSAEQFRSGQDLSAQQFRSGQEQEMFMFDKRVNNEERMAMADVASRYGISLTETDTLETVISKAAPFINDKQVLELEQLRSSIAENKAQTQRALRGDTTVADKGMTQATADSLAMAYISGMPEVINGIKSPEDSAMLINSIQRITREGNDELRSLAGQATSAEEFSNLANSSDMLFTQGQVDAVSNSFVGDWADARAAAKKAERSKKIKDSARDNLIFGGF